MKLLQRIHRSTDVHWVGDGFPVRSVFDYNGLGRELTPFLLLDYAPRHDFPPGTARRGVEAHPHKGFETVTVVLAGELEHRDSSGGGGVIGPGDVQWMTAGRGIVHEEFHSAAFTRRGGPLQMVQLWVNLRAQDKGAAPGYQTLLAAQIPKVPLPAGAGEVRVIAGAFGGQRGPARTFTPIELWDVTLRPGARAELALPPGHTAAGLVLAGPVQFPHLGPDLDATADGKEQAKEAVEGDLAIWSRHGDTLVVQASDRAGDAGGGLAGARLLILAGEPIAEPVVGHGPFVMNSRTEILKAFEEYQSGRMGQLE